MKRFTALSIFVFICVFACSQASAQADLGLRGAGFELGIVGPENVDATLGLGIFADMGEMTPNMMLEAYLNFWTQSEDLFTGGDASVRDIAIGARAKWMFPVSNPKVKPFAGAGLGIHFLKFDTDIPPTILFPQGFRLEDSSTKIGLDIGGGLMAPVNDRTDFIAELWYGFVSDANQLALKAGILYKL